jgi:hypothetical protein
MRSEAVFRRAFPLLVAGFCLLAGRAFAADSHADNFAESLEPEIECPASDRCCELPAPVRAFFFASTRCTPEPEPEKVCEGSKAAPVLRALHRGCVPQAGPLKKAPAPAPERDVRCSQGDQRGAPPPPTQAAKEELSLRAVGALAPSLPPPRSEREPRTQNDSPLRAGVSSLPERPPQG